MTFFSILRKMTTAIVLLFLSTGNLFAGDTTSSSKINILAVPILGYEPETRGHFGAVALLSFDLNSGTDLRSSVAKTKLQYTLNKQLISEVEWDIFFREEKWFSSGQIHFSKYPDFYYGIGPNTSKDSELSYQSNRFSVDVRVLKKLRDNFFGGINTGYTRYSNFKFSEENIKFGELKNSDNYHFGITGLLDTRNSILNATEGLYLLAEAGFHFSESNYSSLLLDFRTYHRWRDRVILAGRMFLDSRFGDPPFFNMAFQGGDQWVRGYLLGRFRDRNLGALQMELRIHLIGRFGFAVFGGMSSLAASADRLITEDLKWNGGAGIRFLIDRENSVNLRIDFALGERGNRGFYVSFGESF